MDARVKPGHDVEAERHASRIRRKRANHFFLSSPFCKNILIFRNRKSVYIPRRPAPLGGALAIVTDVGRDAVDAEGALTNALEADGKTVWS